MLEVQTHKQRRHGDVPSVIGRFLIHGYTGLARQITILGGDGSGYSPPGRRLHKKSW